MSKHKQEALEKVAQFKRDAADVNKLPTKVLLSEQGGEFTGTAFREFCKENRIRPEFTGEILNPPYRSSRAPVAPAHECTAMIDGRWELSAIGVRSCIPYDVFTWQIGYQAF